MRIFWSIICATSSSPSNSVIGISSNGESYPYYSTDSALIQGLLLSQNL